MFECVFFWLFFQCYSFTFASFSSSISESRFSTESTQNRAHATFSLFRVRWCGGLRPSWARVVCCSTILLDGLFCENHTLNLRLGACTATRKLIVRIALTELAHGTYWRIWVRFFIPYIELCYSQTLIEFMALWRSYIPHAYTDHNLEFFNVTTLFA